MKRIVFAALVCLATGLTFGQSSPATFDLIVRNGKVVDGTGNGWFYGDVGVNGQRITAVGDLKDAKATRVIDAKGLVVAPGFIDVHTHVDDDIFTNRAAENFIRDGVTTIISGNCGGSVTEVGEFFDRMEKQPATVNHGTLIGHNSVLKKVKGGAIKGDLTPEQMTQAKGIVDQAMKDGAVGFSTGLIYTPGMWSSTGEIVELMKSASPYGGIYASHMRSEGTSIVEAIDEALTVGREAKCRVEISHFKLPTVSAEKLGRGTMVDGKMIAAGSDITLAKVHAARKEGMEVWLDQYPYTASSTTIATLLPDWVLEKGPEEAKKILNDPEQVKKVFDEMRAPPGKSGTRSGRADLSYVAIASSPGHPEWAGMNVKQIATFLQKPQAGGEMIKPAARQGEEVSLDEQFKVVAELYVTGGASAVFHSMDEIEVANIMKDPLVSIARDSGVRKFGAGVPHPRSYGTATRVLGRYVRELGVITLEDAVRKLASQPATAFRLADRGVIRVGAYADLTLFNADTVADQATFDKPHQYPVGVEYVVVNGTPVLEKGTVSEARPGLPVRGPGWTGRK